MWRTCTRQSTSRACSATLGRILLQSCRSASIGAPQAVRALTACAPTKHSRSSCVRPASPTSVSGFGCWTLNPRPSTAFPSPASSQRCARIPPTSSNAHFRGRVMSTRCVTCLDAPAHICSRGSMAHRETGGLGRRASRASLSSRCANAPGVGPSPPPTSRTRARRTLWWRASWTARTGPPLALSRAPVRDAPKWRSATCPPPGMHSCKILARTRVASPGTSRS
mmetsp:Transcript_5104/g.15084  ORF Transcript_5104/g.15084 Transcript_5104/m.15084 type:complete len:224 (-) Transcript_5104:470-1141(-)